VARLATLGAISFDGEIFDGPHRKLPLAYPVAASELEQMEPPNPLITRLASGLHAAG
jgi:hypothetical protein